MREYWTITKGGLSNAAILEPVRTNKTRFLVENIKMAEKNISQITFPDQGLVLSLNELTMLRNAVDSSGEVIFMTDREGMIKIYREFNKPSGKECHRLEGLIP